LLEDFEDDEVSLIGVSTDSFYSHGAWFADREIFPDEITHPVVADTNHSLSRAFGVLKDDLGVSYRGTIIVDDQGTVVPKKCCERSKHYKAADFAVRIGKAATDLWRSDNV